jgi:hypothetical protein
MPAAKHYGHIAGGAPPPTSNIISVNGILVADIAALNAVAYENIKSINGVTVE